MILPKLTLHTSGTSSRVDAKLLVGRCEFIRLLPRTDGGFTNVAAAIIDPRTFYFNMLPAEATDQANIELGIEEHPAAYGMSFFDIEFYVTGETPVRIRIDTPGFVGHQESTEPGERLNITYKIGKPEVQMSKSKLSKE